MKFGKVIGRYKDVPQMPSYSGIAVVAGSAADFEHVIAHVPDLTLGATSGSVGDIASNMMVVRYVFLVFEAAITGAATNNCAFSFRQYRAGALVATTTATTAVAAPGSTVITPASMAGIFVGQTLAISGGTGTAESVVVTNVTSTSFTAVFANTHSGTYTIVQAPLATVTFASGTNAVAYTPIKFAVPKNSNTIQGGDILTIARISSNATGLATTAYLAGIDWVPSGAV